MRPLNFKEMDVDLDLGAMRIHCPATAFDDLIAALRALDEGAVGAVSTAARLAREYDRGIGDLTRYQRSMLRVASGTEREAVRSAAARAAFRSIARAVVRMREKKPTGICKKRGARWST